MIISDKTAIVGIVIELDEEELGHISKLDKIGEKLFDEIRFRAQDFIRNKDKVNTLRWV